MFSGTRPWPLLFIQQTKWLKNIYLPVDKKYLSTFVDKSFLSTFFAIEKVDENVLSTGR